MSSSPSLVNLTPSVEESMDDFSSQAFFYLNYKDIEHTTSVSRDQVDSLDHHKAIFLTSLSNWTPETKSNVQFSLPESAVCLLAQFIQFLLERQVAKSAIRSLVRVFRRDFLVLTDIHSLVSTLPDSTAVQKSILRTYYTALSQCSLSSGLERSALFREAEQGNASLLAVFGGQGAFNPRCFEELRDIYVTYSPFLEDLIESIDSVLSESCRLSETSDFYHGREISLRTWLDHPETVPNGDYIATAPVSFPIIGAISLAHFCVVCKVLEKSPGEIRSLLQGVTGHSQGIVVAAGIARSDSWSSFYENARLVTRMLFWLGYESHRAAPKCPLPASLVSGSEENEEGKPSPMLHIGGLQRSQIDNVVGKCNNELPPGQQLHLALSNTRDSYVVAGPARSLIGLNAHLRDLKASEGLDQSRIPFDHRKPIVKNQFLPISAPFHTPYLTKAAQRIKERLSNEKFEATELKIPVYHSQDGSDMRNGVTDVLSSLIDAVTTQHVDWPSTLRSAKSTHILAFGKGVGEIVSKNKEGKGVRVIFGTQLVPLKEGAGARPEIFAPQLPRDSMRIQSWEEQFGPQLFKSSTGQIGLKTKLSQLLGTPPIIIGGMTPTTVPWDFVSSIMNAGYHVELAGGGYYNSESMSAAIANVTAHVPPGRGITCNLIYASPHAMKWQIAMLRQLAQKGHPIDGLTIGAGVPNLEVAGEYINTLGLRHLSLKPGSEDAIMNVLELAKAYPYFPIILQWTGGRGGGHHSFEDLHIPILHLYGKIRQCPNVVLVAGSGFGDATNSYPYLTGAWSTQFGYAKMPFDGILLGSRVMVAKEAHTSPQAKALICEAPGCQNSDWTMTYSKPTGGVVTVQSEMGQPIHKIATRAVLFWKEMDEQIFNLPRAKQLEAIEKRKDYIIRRLNADFCKPWFGRNSAGDVVDLSEMTYSEVLDRLISLMYVSHQKRWINKSYSALVHDFIIRTVERIPTNFEMAISMLSEPESLEAKFCTACPQASYLKLHPEDVSWFINRCRSRGQKPVNFVPVFDDNFAVWFKKDSLWQSEDVDAVVDQDAGRVCILHSPVGASYSQRTDEPVKEILDGINNGLIVLTQQEFYNDAEIPLDAPVDTIFQRSVSLDSVQFTESLGTKIFQLLPGEIIPSQNQWFEHLASQTNGWMRAVFSSQDILRKNTRQPNFLRRIFEIRADNIMRIDFTQSTVSIVPVSNGPAPALVEMSSKSNSKIAVHVRHITPRDSVPVILELEFKYNPDNSVCPLSEIMGRRNPQVQSFYSKLWLGTDLNIGYGLHSTFSGKSTVLTAEMLDNWMLSVGLSYSNDATLPHDTDIFPINASIVPAWEGLMKPLLVRDIDGDILKLVHLSNSFQLLPGATPLRIGDSIDVSSRIQAVTIEDSGKSIVVCATIEREHKPVVSVTSTFLIQGSFSDFRSTFRRKTEDDIVFDVTSHIEEALLRDREWLLLDKASLNLVGKRLLFRLYTYTTWKNRTTFRTLRTTGEVFILDQNDSLSLIGEVMSESLNCRANLVMDFLSRKGQPAVQRHELEHPGWSGKSSMVVKMPLSSQNYGRVSKDYNPIHVSPIFATIANLPSPIVHGMYTSAVASSVLEHLLDDGDRLRARRYSVSFLAKVLPGEELKVKVQHVAMIQGRMVFKVEAFKLDSDEKVLVGEAEFEQLPTAYVFTGQGSQAPSMGMDLYKSSPVAKKIWDDTDAYLFENYGWSILQIVRENPKELTIHFGGKRGKKIREKYLAMKVDSTTPDGNTVSRSVLQDLDSNTPSFTFTEARGLLYSTQFAQPAICLLEKAAFEDIRAKGLVQEGALFAGHSLGEYGVLSALAEFMPFESMMDLVFYRGLAMQTAMARDEFGETGYSMVAVNPKRVGKGFSEDAIRRVTSMIANESKQLLEIVNFNVEGEQYVCAGHLRNIHALTLTLNALSQLSPVNLSSTILDTTSLSQIITKSVHASSLLPEPISLTRGKASIPLTGIDVPFHSSLLRPGVGHYRRFLQDKIREQDVQVEKLEGRWIPNVMGSLFDVSSEFVKKVQERTGSEILREVLAAEVVV